MEKMNRNYLILKIIDFDCDPDEISRKLHLEASNSYRKGTRIYRRRLRDGSGKYDESGPSYLAKWNYWEYQVPHIGDEWILEPLEKFIEEIITPRAVILKELSRSCDVEITVVQYYYTGCNPGYSFDNKLLGTIYESGAALDIDVYCLRDVRDDKPD